MFSSPRNSAIHKRRHKAIFVPILVCAFVLLGFAACRPGSTSGTTLRIAHPLDSSHPNHQALTFFAEDLEARSGGRMRAVIYPGGQLGTDRECLELLQIGSLDMTVASAGVVEAFVPDFKIFSLPYLFANRESRLAALDGEFGEALLVTAIPSRLRGLAYFDAGSRSFYTKDAVVNNPEDLIGKKIRVMGSPMDIRTVRALGGSPTPVSWGELYTALQQGVVDAAENNPTSLYTSRHYEITRYFSLNEHTAIPDILIMGEPSWSRLSPQEQEWVVASAKAAAGFQRNLWATTEAEAMERLIADGVTIHHPDKTPFIEAVAPLYRDFESEEPRLFQYVEKIRKP